MLSICWCTHDSCSTRPYRMRHDPGVGADLKHLSQHRHQAGVVQEVLVILCSSTTHPWIMSANPAASM
jgi:hypothetical protein